MALPKRSEQTPHFAHDSERHLSELLDFYGIAWIYEPVAFNLAWDEHGKPTSAFRPDFYLPDHNLYLELTTLRQELVTRKNRKVRQVEALYPGINVKILYRRDYANLLMKMRLGAEIGTRSLVEKPSRLHQSKRSA